MPQYITGDKGLVTFSGAEGVVVADLGAWQATISRNVYPTTPFGYLIDRVTLGRNSVRGSFVGFFDGGTTPPIPANGSTIGTLTLAINTSSPGTATRYYRFPARIFSLGIGANSVEGGPIQQQYGFVSCADSNTDNITVV